MGLSMSEVAENNPATAGSLLRGAREAAGIHIEALAVALKVPVSKLEALGSQGTLYVQLPSGHRVYDGLSAKARDQYQVVHQLDASQLHAVVVQVRDKVLDWALELTKAGTMLTNVTCGICCSRSRICRPVVPGSPSM